MPRIRDFLPGADAGPPADTQEQDRTDFDELLGRPVITGGDAATSFYPIGRLAAALNRSAGTLRDWERAGIIPEGYVINGDSRNGRRRVYTGQQIRGLRQLALECGILDDLRAVVKGSEFSRLSYMLFDRLRDAAL